MTVMNTLQDIYTAISAQHFDRQTLLLIDKYINDIQNGNTDFYRFNQSEHAGFCKAGSALIGATAIADYAARSLRTSGHVEGC